MSVVDVSAALLRCVCVCCVFREFLRGFKNDVRQPLQLQLGSVVFSDLRF